MQNRNKGENEDSFHLYPAFSCYIGSFPPTRKKGESNKVTGKISGTGRKQENNGIPSKYPPNDFIRNQAPTQHNIQHSTTSKRSIPCITPTFPLPVPPERGISTITGGFRWGTTTRPGRRNAPKTAPTRAAEN